MTDPAGNWEQLELFLVPTVAMRRGEQSVWQCAHCGAVVVIPSPRGAKKPQHGCSSCGQSGEWWKQHLPVADATYCRCTNRPSLAGLARRP